MSTPSSFHRFYRSILWLLIGLLSASVLGTFPVAGQNVQGLRGQKPISIRGSLSAGLTYYQADGIANRRKPFSWYLSGAPVITIYGVVMPFSLVVSEQESRFSQPFNQYGVSPYYKWAKLHLGYRNIRFSNYTLGGANFLGAGLELNPGKLRLGFVYGQFSRAVSEDTVAYNGRNQYVRPSYRRLGMGAKLGFGTASSYVDLVLFKATDEINSIATPSRRSLVTPMENLSAGIRSQFGFWKRKLVFDVDLGGSLLTRNLLLGNGSTRFNIPALSRFLWINESTAFFTAGQVSVNYRAKQGGLGVVYQRIDPDYQSLGAYFFQNDLEQLTINPTYSLLAGRLNLSGSYGISHDNLNGLRSQTTKRTISALNINYVPAPRVQINASYSNFGLGQSRGLADQFNDSLAVSIVNSAYSGSIAYRRGNRRLNQSLSLSGTYQSTDDQNQFTRQYSAASSKLASLTYALSWPVQHMSLTTSGNYVAIDTYGREMVNMGATVNLSRQWLKGRVRTSLNHASQSRTLNGLPDGLFSSTGLSVALHQGKQTLTVNSYYLFNRYQAQADGVLFRNFTEMRGNLLYGVSF